MPRNISSLTNSDNLDACLDEYLGRLKECIRQRATELTETSFLKIRGSIPLLAFKN